MNTFEDILKENRFELKKTEEFEYNNTYIEDRWYYGPYIYLIQEKFPDRENIWYLYVDKNKYKDWVGKRICAFDIEFEDIDKIRGVCKEFYSDLNKKLKKDIEKLESKREEIMNFVF